MADLATTDLRPDLLRIAAPVLAISTDLPGADSARRVTMHAAYAAQITAIADHTLQMAPDSRHFVMIDDLRWLLRAADAFLARARQ